MGAIKDTLRKMLAEEAQRTGRDIRFLDTPTRVIETDKHAKQHDSEMSKTDNKNCNGWISTSEALPPLKTRVLIVESGAGRSTIRIAKLLGQAQSGVWYWSAQNTASRITHWQPLPQLPNDHE